MTNLDSILKSKDITLRTKVHTVKALVFPIVMYGCESQTIKKAEEPKSLLMRVKEENEKADLKLNIKRTKIMASSPITSR